MEEGRQFECVWTHRPIRSGDAFDLDHLIPVSVYPINEVWNLIPTHPSANRSKSDKIPSIDLLERAVRPLSQTYQLYTGSPDLRRALVDATRLRFSTELSQRDFEQDLAHRVIRFMDYIAEARSLGRVERFG
jgi:hypothetical protein